MTVVMTGVTGFLGSRLLRGLLVEQGRAVAVLGRGDAEGLHARVVAALAATGEGSMPEESLRRLRCVGADLTRPDLGLTSKESDRLAHEATVVWHCAGDITLDAAPGRLRAVNVDGTARVLDLAARTDPNCRMIHTSTAFVAGRRHDTVVAEDDLDASHGFENAYERSKFEAECLVHEWSLRHDRPATILRPSVLVTTGAVPSGTAGHPLETFGRLVDALANMWPTAPGAPEALRLRVRLAPDATLNLVQVEYACVAMLRAAQGPEHPCGVRTLHVVHPRATTVRDLIAAVRRRHPRVEIAPVDVLTDPDLPEAAVDAGLGIFLGYARNNRTYDRSNLLSVCGAVHDPRDIDREYLERALGAAPACENAGARVVDAPRSQSPRAVAGPR